MAAHTQSHGKCSKRSHRERSLCVERANDENEIPIHTHTRSCVLVCTSAIATETDMPAPAAAAATAVAITRYTPIRPSFTHAKAYLRH